MLRTSFGTCLHSTKVLIISLKRVMLMVEVFGQGKADMWMGYGPTIMPYKHLCTGKTLSKGEMTGAAVLCRGHAHTQGLPVCEVLSGRRARPRGLFYCTSLGFWMSLNCHGSAHENLLLPMKVRSSFA